MLTFKQYLFEEMFLVEITKIENPDRGRVHHTATIKGHEMKVSYYRLSRDSTSPYYNQYDVDFERNNSFTRRLKGIPGAHRHAMTNFVLSSLHSFIKEKKPDKISWFGNTARKGEAYEKIAGHIAKKHNGVSGKDSITFRDAHKKGT